MVAAHQAAIHHRVAHVRQAVVILLAHQAVRAEAIVAVVAAEAEAEEVPAVQVVAAAPVAAVAAGKR